MSKQLFEEVEKLPEDGDVVKNKKKEIEQSNQQNFDGYKENS